MAQRFDAVVIGGGPAGSTVGALGAQLGRRVCVLEREKFPRFHVGESLLPFNNNLFRALGVMDQLEDRAVNIRKYAATFMDGSGQRRQTFYFDKALRDDNPYAFHVERAGFDKMLLDNAARLGADVREQWQVLELLRDGDRVVGVVGRDPEGATHELRAPLVVDASGRTTFIGSALGLREPHPELKKASLYAHFEGEQRQEGRAEGNIRIMAFEDGWAWVIPFASGRTSVGLVLHGKRFKERSGSMEELWDECVARAPSLAAILEGATRVTDLYTESAVAYTNRQMSGDGWVMVGDSALFLDPVFSTGVLLAMTSGALVANVLVSQAGEGWKPTARTFADYESTIQRALGNVYPFIKGFYDPSFFDRFLRPSDLFGMQRAITSILSGDVMSPWHHRLRHSLFWLGVDRNRRARSQASLDVRSTLTD